VSHFHIFLTSLEMFDGLVPVLMKISRASRRTLTETFNSRMNGYHLKISTEPFHPHNLSFNFGFPGHVLIYS
jgi:hypothetical protein